MPATIPSASRMGAACQATSRSPRVLLSTGHSKWPHHLVAGDVPPEERSHAVSDAGRHERVEPARPEDVGLLPAEQLAAGPVDVRHPSAVAQGQQHRLRHVEVVVELDGHEDRRHASGDVIHGLAIPASRHGCGSTSTWSQPDNRRRRLRLPPDRARLEVYAVPRRRLPAARMVRCHGVQAGPGRLAGGGAVRTGSDRAFQIAGDRAYGARESTEARGEGGRTMQDTDARPRIGIRNALLTLAVLALAAAPAAAQQDLGNLMRQKLDRAQGLFEAVVLARFPAARRYAGDLLRISETVHLDAAGDAVVPSLRGGVPGSRAKPRPGGRGPRHRRGIDRVHDADLYLRAMSPAAAGIPAGRARPRARPAGARRFRSPRPPRAAEQ